MKHVPVTKMSASSVVQLWREIGHARSRKPLLICLTIALAGCVHKPASPPAVPSTSVDQKPETNENPCRVIASDRCWGMSTFADIFFRLNSAEVDPKERVKLDEFLRKITLAHYIDELVITGHTDLRAGMR